MTNLVSLRSKASPNTFFQEKKFKANIPLNIQPQPRFTTGGKKKRMIKPSSKISTNTKNITHDFIIQKKKQKISIKKNVPEKFYIERRFYLQETEFADLEGQAGSELMRSFSKFMMIYGKICILIFDDERNI